VVVVVVVVVLVVVVVVVVVVVSRIGPSTGCAAVANSKTAVEKTYPQEREYAYFIHSIPFPLRIRLPLLNSTEFMVPIMSSSYYLYCF
jgi:hypothetical protein